jgi:hypothetical protein
MAARTISRSCTQSSHTAPAARIFLQLASRRPHPVLDFLAPRVSQHAPPLPLRSIPKATSRAFSTTSTLKETVAIYNPRKDDDGQDMNVEITARASNVSYRNQPPRPSYWKLTKLISASEKSWPKTKIQTLPFALPSKAAVATASNTSCP